MMPEDEFWTIIDGSRTKATKVKLKAGEDFLSVHEHTLAEALEQLTPDKIVRFAERFSSYQSLAYRWDLWGAAYWLFGGCGDDGFIDFRACLISLGKTLFFQVLEDPDSLADIVGQKHIPFLQAEGFQYVALKVYRAKTGHDKPWSEGTMDAGPAPKKPVGKKFDFEDEEAMEERFPRIVAKFELGDAG
jgi:hypothetical protein